MIIQDDDCECDTTDASKIEQILSRRYAGHNHFWLGHGQRKFPSITIFQATGLPRERRLAVEFGRQRGVDVKIEVYP